MSPTGGGVVQQRGDATPGLPGGAGPSRTPRGVDRTGHPGQGPQGGSRAWSAEHKTRVARADLPWGEGPTSSAPQTTSGAKLVEIKSLSIILAHLSP